MRALLLFAALLALVDPAAAQRSIRAEEWGATPDGERVQLFTLTNAKGMRARIATYGGILVSLEVPDRAGKLGDVLAGFDSLQGYLGEHPYMGALIGRYGNRIAKGRFSLDGRTYSLAVNNGPNALHGGLRGFDKRVWAAKPFDADDGPGLELFLLSPDGEEGYPGALTVRARYTLTDTNAIRIEYFVVTDAPTVKSITNHAYFNLKDGGSYSALDHEVEIFADHFTPVDSTLIPTGVLEPVEGTPFDFRQPKAIGARIDLPTEQLRNGGGYDHNFVLSRRTGDGLELAVRVHEPTTGRVMEAWTTEPGVQFYTGNFLDGSLTGKGATRYARRAAFCLETQHFPDSPNRPEFPSTVLRPGQTYRSTTEYRFSVR